MSPSNGPTGFPQAPLLGAAALIALSLIAAAAGRWSGSGEPDLLTAGTNSPSQGHSRDLRFGDLADGGVLVVDTTTGEEVAVLPPGDGGFVRATLRALARQRQQQGVSPTVPFRLLLLPDGRLLLLDPATKAQVELQAFGPDNLAAFARFLPVHGRG